MTWLSPEALIAACETPIAGLLRSHPHQSIRRVRQLVAEWATQPSWPLGRRDDQGLVVIAVDALTYGFAERILSCDQLVCLTSSFPSTSVVSWLSSVTGAGPAQHGVAGPVALRDGVDGVYNIIRGHAATFDGPIATNRPATPRPLRAQATLFDDLRDAGVPSVALIGDFLGICEGWIGSLVAGSLRRDPPRVLDNIRTNPKAMTSLAIEQIEAELGDHGRQCVWAYVNLDEHIHFEGYDEALARVLEDLQRSARRWAARGYTVILYSDHGQIANECVPAHLAAFEALAGPHRCRLPAGGAGRVRWLYPKVGQEDDLLERLRDLLGAHAFVCRADEAPATGLVEQCGLPGAGALVAIATDARFPVPDPKYRYEHGSATAEEMLVPFAIWGPS